MPPRATRNTERGRVRWSGCASNCLGAITSSNKNVGGIDATPARSALTAKARTPSLRTRRASSGCGFARTGITIKTHTIPSNIATAVPKAG